MTYSKQFQMREYPFWLLFIMHEFLNKNFNTLAKVKDKTDIKVIYSIVGLSANECFDVYLQTGILLPTKQKNKFIKYITALEAFHIVVEQYARDIVDKVKTIEEIEKETKHYKKQAILVKAIETVVNKYEKSKI